MEQLKDHDLLLYQAPVTSRVADPAEPSSGLTPRITCDNYAFLRQLAADGDGVVLMPEALAARDVDRGRLVRVLEGWRSPPSALALVFPSKRDITPRVRAFADHVADALAGWRSSSQADGVAAAGG